MPRQRDHVFRAQSGLFLQYYFTIFVVAIPSNVTMFSGHTVVYFCNITIFVVATPSRHQDLNIFQILSGPWGSITLSHCLCRKAIKLSRAQLWQNESQMKTAYLIIAKRNAHNNSLKVYCLHGTQQSSMSHKNLGKMNFEPTKIEWHLLLIEKINWPFIKFYNFNLF